MKEGGGSGLARLCLAEMEETDMERKIGSNWEEEITAFFEKKELRRQEKGEGCEEWFERG